MWGPWNHDCGNSTYRKKIVSWTSQEHRNGAEILLASLPDWKVMVTLATLR